VKKWVPIPSGKGEKRGPPTLQQEGVQKTSKDNQKRLKKRARNTALHVDHPRSSIKRDTVNGERNNGEGLRCATAVKKQSNNKATTNDVGKATLQWEVNTTQYNDSYIRGDSSRVITCFLGLSVFGLPLKLPMEKPPRGKPGHKDPGTARP